MLAGDFSPRLAVRGSSRRVAPAQVVPRQIPRSISYRFEPSLRDGPFVRGHNSGAEAPRLTSIGPYGTVRAA